MMRHVSTTEYIYDIRYKQSTLRRVIPTLSDACNRHFALIHACTGHLLPCMHAIVSCRVQRVQACIEWASAHAEKRGFEWFEGKSIFFCCFEQVIRERDGGSALMLP